MADNVEIPDNAGSGVRAATDKVTYSGDTADVQIVRIAQVTGTEGAKTVVDLPGDASNGLTVNLGTNNDVIVSQLSDFISTANSTSTPLAGGAAFTGTGEDVSHYNAVGVQVYASHASAASGLSLEFSTDNTNWDFKGLYTISANSARYISLPRSARYFRVVYTNGATLQTSFRLQTIFSTTAINQAVAIDTELPSAASLGDDKTNPSLPWVAGFGMVFDGSTWDRMRGDSTNGTLVNLGTNNDVTASQTGTWNITDVSGTVSLPTGASTLAEQQTQTTHLATIAGDTTAIETAVQLIDDTVATLGTTTYSEATTKGLIVGAVRRDADTTLVDTTNEVTPLQVDANGRLKVEAFSGETLPVSLASTTITGTVAVTQSGTWDEVGINDSGNSITVDAPAGTPVNVQVGDGSNTATIRNLAANDALNVAIVDGAGDQITSFGGGTQYTEGDTDATIVGTALLFEGAGDTLVAAPGTAADGLLVNLGSNNDVTVTGTVTANAGTGSFTVAQATAANLNATVVGTGTFTTQVSSISAGDNNIGNVDIVTMPGTAAEAAALPSVFVVVAGDDGTDTQPLQLNAGGDLKVTLDSETVAIASIAAGDNNIGNVDVVTLPALAAGTNNIGDVDILTVNGQAPAFGTGTRSAATQRVTIATDDIVPASQSGTWTVQPGNTQNTTAWLTANATRTSGGPTTYHLVSAGSTNATNIKASAGQVYGWFIYNSNASMRKVVFHNTAGTPTAGASVYFTLCIPAGSGANVFLPHGIPFSTGIAITTVTGIADSNSTAVAADDLNINIWYA